MHSDVISAFCASRLNVGTQAALRSPVHVREEVVRGPRHRERLFLAL